MTASQPNQSQPGQPIAPYDGACFAICTYFTLETDTQKYPEGQRARVARALGQIRQTLEEIAALDNGRALNTEPCYSDASHTLLDSDSDTCAICEKILVNTGGDGAQETASLAAPTPASDITAAIADVKADTPTVSAPGQAVAAHAPQNIQFNTPAALPLVPPTVHQPCQGVTNEEPCWYVVTRGLNVGIFLGW